MLLQYRLEQTFTIDLFSFSPSCYRDLVFLRYNLKKVNTSMEKHAHDKIPFYWLVLHIDIYRYIDIYKYIL